MDDEEGKYKIKVKKTARNFSRILQPMICVVLINFAYYWSHKWLGWTSSTVSCVSQTETLELGLKAPGQWGKLGCKLRRTTADNFALVILVHSAYGLNKNAHAGLCQLFLLTWLLMILALLQTRCVNFKKRVMFAFKLSLYLIHQTSISTFSTLYLQEYLNFQSRKKKTSTQLQPLFIDF